MCCKSSSVEKLMFPRISPGQYINWQHSEVKKELERASVRNAFFYKIKMVNVDYFQLQRVRILVNHKIEIRKEKSKDNEKIRTGKE